jgi:hypothetical protein
MVINMTAKGAIGVNNEKIATDISMYSCLLHPDRKAHVFTGHIHVYGTTVCAGWCDKCHKNGVIDELDSSSICEGCFGRLEGLR